MKSNNTATVFNKYAKVYENKFMDTSIFHGTYDLFLKYLVSNDATILDIGCGPGNITKYFLNTLPELNILGIDIAHEMILLAKNNNPSACFKVLDGNSIHTINLSFDGIISGFCLPYFSKEEVNTFINNSYQLLNRNGVLYISTMEGSYENSKYIGTSSGGNECIYTHYYPEKYLKKVLFENGFKILETVKIKQQVKNNDTEIIDIILIAQKQHYEYTN